MDIWYKREEVNKVNEKDILAKLDEQVQTSANHSNLYEQLNSVERAIADKADKLFDKCAKLSKDSKSSYKSNLKKALIQIRTGQTLTNNQKSAYRLFKDLSAE